MPHYIALIHNDEGTDYGVMFPDFPGCISSGSTTDEAIRMATEALSGHVEAMVRDGEIIPLPRSLEAIKVAGEDWIDFEGATIALIPLLPISERTVRIGPNVEERLLAEIDAVAGSRDAFFAEAARARLNADRD